MLPLCSISLVLLSNIYLLKRRLVDFFRTSRNFRSVNRPTLRPSDSSALARSALLNHKTNRDARPTTTVMSNGVPPYGWNSPYGYIPPVNAPGPIPFYPPPPPTTVPFFYPPVPGMMPPPFASAPGATPPAVPGINFPGGQRTGTCYLYPQDVTTIHVIRDTKVWEITPTTPSFSIFQIETTATAQELIGRLGGDADWAITEVFDRGGGKWTKGSSFAHKEDKAKDQIKKFGWTAKRGESQEPVWIVLHKA